MKIKLLISSLCITILELIGDIKSIFQIISVLLKLLRDDMSFISDRHQSFHFRKVFCNFKTFLNLLL